MIYYRSTYIKHESSIPENNFAKIRRNEARKNEKRKMMPGAKAVNLVE